jgi:hypothetical protein
LFYLLVLCTGVIGGANDAPRIARLQGWRLAFNKRSSKGRVVANIVRGSSRDEVVGVVYRWSRQARETMRDDWEIGYSEKEVEVVTEAGQRLPAITFVANPEHVVGESAPAEAYLDKIVRGAHQHGLPEEYIERVIRQARGGS